MRRYLGLAIFLLGGLAALAIALVFASGHVAAGMAAALPFLIGMSDHSSLTDVTDTTAEIYPQSLSGAAGDTNGGGVDMKGWEGVVFTIAVGAITGAGTLDGRAQSSPTSVTCTDMANIASSSITQVTNANPNTVVQISIYRPTNRYVRCVLNQQANTVVAGVTATRFRRSGVNPGANVGQPSQSPLQIVKVVQN